MKPTVVVTNLGLAGGGISCAGGSLEAYLGMRAVDRLRENGGRALVFAGKSYRTNRVG